jgi:hypothetical protein
VKRNKAVSREAAAGIGRAESAVATSRLKIIIGLNSVGLNGYLLPSLRDSGNVQPQKA